MKTYSDFTNLYPVSKTLRFELKPIGKTKENIEKSYNFGASEFNREMKRLAQKQLKQGLPVTVDIPNDADAEDLAMLNAFDKWLRDGQPVE